jgi:uncharacterized lipoprotein NlpE involved in copper resistance
MSRAATLIAILAPLTIAGCNRRTDEAGTRGSADTVVTKREMQDTAVIRHDTTVSTDTVHKRGDHAVDTDTVHK